MTPSSPHRSTASPTRRPPPHRLVLPCHLSPDFSSHTPAITSLQKTHSHSPRIPHRRRRRRPPAERPDTPPARAAAHDRGRDHDRADPHAGAAVHHRADRIAARDNLVRIARAAGRAAAAAVAAVRRGRSWSCSWGRSLRAAGHRTGSAPAPVPVLAHSPAPARIPALVRSPGPGRSPDPVHSHADYTARRHHPDAVAAAAAVPTTTTATRTLMAAAHSSARKIGRRCCSAVGTAAARQRSRAQETTKHS